MTPPPTRRQLANVFDLLTDLRLAGRTGTELVVPPGARADLAVYLGFVLTDPQDGLLPHLRFVNRLFGGTAPEGAPLPEPLALAIEERGPDALLDTDLFPTGSALARLLLDAGAVRDLEHQIATELPDAWLPLVEAHGRRLANTKGADLSGKPSRRAGRARLVPAFHSVRAPGPIMAPPPTRTINVRFDGPDGAAAHCWLAGAALGDPDAEFVLRVHWCDGRGELELDRAARHEVRVTVRCPGNGPREVTLPAAPEGAPSRTALPAPVPPFAPAPGSAAFEWHEGAFVLVLRAADAVRARVE